MIRKVDATNLPSEAVSLWRGFLNIRELLTSQKFRDNKQLRMETALSGLSYAASELSLPEISLYTAQLVSSGDMQIGEANKTALALLSLFVYARRGDQYMTDRLKSVLKNNTPLHQYLSEGELQNEISRVFGTNRKHKKPNQLDNFIDGLNRTINWSDDKIDVCTEQIFTGSFGIWTDALLMPLTGRQRKDENNSNHIGNIIRAKIQQNAS